MRLTHPLGTPFLLGATLGATLVASACELGIDDSLIKPTPDAAVCPEGHVCTPVEDADVTEPDAEIPPDGDDGGTTSDASSDDATEPHPVGEAGANLDAKVIDPMRDAELDASPPDPQPVACNDDTICGAEEFCSTNGTCKARCDAKNNCVVANTGQLKVTSMLSGNDTVLFATSTSTDALNNRRHDGAIWRLNANGTSTKAVSEIDTAYLRQIIDGQIYFADGYTFHDTRNLPALRQAPLAGGQSEPVVLGGNPARFVAASPSYVWFGTTVTSTASQTSFELWRLPRIGGTSEKIKDIAGRKLLAATDAGVFYARWDDPPSGLMTDLMYDDLSGGPARLVSSAGFYWYDAAVSGDRVVGTTWYGDPVNALSVPLQPGSDTLSLLSPPRGIVDNVSVGTQFAAPWFYWVQSYLDNMKRPHARFGRSHQTLGFAPEVVAELQTSGGATFAVAPSGEAIFYFDRQENRLIRLPIAPLPCSASVACPEGRSCQPDNTCH